MTSGELPPVGAVPVDSLLSTGDPSADLTTARDVLSGIRVQLSAAAARELDAARQGVARTVAVVNGHVKEQLDAGRAAAERAQTAGENHLHEELSRALVIAQEYGIDLLPPEEAVTRYSSVPATPAGLPLPSPQDVWYVIYYPPVRGCVILPLDRSLPRPANYRAGPFVLRAQASSWLQGHPTACTPLPGDTERAQEPLPPTIPPGGQPVRPPAGCRGPHGQGAAIPAEAWQTDESGVYYILGVSYPVDGWYCARHIDPFTGQFGFRAEFHERGTFMQGVLGVWGGVFPDQQSAQAWCSCTTPADTCPAGQHWDAVSQTCVCDLPPEPTCAAGTHPDPVTHQCIPDPCPKCCCCPCECPKPPEPPPKPKCPEGQHWDEVTQSCVPDS